MARGGAERFLLDLLKHLDKSVFSISVILFKSKGSFYQELKNLNISVYLLKKPSLLGLINFYRLFLLLKKIKPHIVHTQLGGDIRGRLAAFLAKIKIIISTEQNLNKSEAWYQRLAKIASAPLANEIVAISQAVANDMKHRYCLPARKCQLIIPNGLDLKKFIYSERKKSGEKIHVGVIGRLHQQKGFDLLIEAWRELSPTNAQLSIAGDGPEKNNLENQIIEAKLQDTINLLGDLNHVNAFYEGLNLLVIPSRWEGLGIVALEAGAKGVPILASDADGLKDILNTETAWIFQAGNKDSLMSQLNEALQGLNKESANKKRGALRKHIESHFDIIQVTQKYARLYLKLWRQKYEDTASK